MFHKMNTDVDPILFVLDLVFVAGLVMEMEIYLI